MNPVAEENENLFSYGTLQKAAVQLSTFGRRLQGSADTLVGYRLKLVPVQDQKFAAESGAMQHSVQFTGVAADVVAGMVFEVTKAELARADRYEPVDYERRRVQLKSGISAWIYQSIRST